MRNRRFALGLLFLLAALATNGCRPAQSLPPVETPSPSGIMAAPVTGPDAATASETQPSVGQGDLGELVRGNRALALDLYHALRDESSRKVAGNLFFSPYSVSAALAMTYAGARTETQARMAQTLHFSLPPERLPRAFHGLALALAERGQGRSGQEDTGGEARTGFQLHMANSLWAQKGYFFRPQFFDLLAENYGAELRLVDFADDAEAARLMINDWVASQTEGRIEELIPPGLIDAMTTLALSNTVYFDAAWATPFEPSLTGEGAFYLLDGSEVTVPMMRQTTSLGYAEGKGYQAVELPYGGHELSMVILMPGQGELEHLIFSLGNRPSGLLEMGHLSSQRLSIWPMPFSQLCRIVSQGSTIGRGGKRWNPRIGACGSSWL